MKSIKKRTQALGAVVVVSLVTGVFFTNCAKNGFNIERKESVGADPLVEYAWHLSNSGQKVFAEEGGTPGNDLNLLNTWNEGISGKGLRILISDDGVEDTHEDLQSNYLYGSYSKNYQLSAPYLANSSPPLNVDDNHGTAVAGLVGAVGSNAKGSRGVAFGASIVSANFLSAAVTPSQSTLVDQAGGNYDIFNMSWGSTQNDLIDPVDPFQSQMRERALNGRSGRGSIYVKSAGNDFLVKCHNDTSSYCIGNANYDSDNSTPYTILVSALNAMGYAASYSSPGANVWISSFGGEFGDDSPAMVTTDRTGCSDGFATSSSTSKVAFERGAQGNTGCKYSVTFNGTSSAAPVMSGAVALLLEANPNLTWRDVKYIFAKTASSIQYSTSPLYTHPLREALPSGYAWELGWITNAAGFKFHNWYGFGRVNVDAAVAMAKSYTSPFSSFIETNWANDRSGLSSAIPDNSATGVTDTMSVGTNIKIESVQLKVWITHPNISELALELTSPSGTKNIVINANNALRGIGNYAGEVFLSNAFYRENSGGTWTLRVVDAKSMNTGTLTRWSLSFTGSN